MCRLHQTVLVAGASLFLLGCASTPQTAALVLPPVGPYPGTHAGLPVEGSLRVFSGRQSAHVDPVAAEFFQNNDFGKNDFLWHPAHTDYTIYTPDGKVFKRVRNSVYSEDATPTLVHIPVGRYQILAEAEINGSVAWVKLPVEIKAGTCTEAHLEGEWRPRVPFRETQLVRLPDGQIVGWKAPVIDHLAVKSERNPS